MCRRTWAISTRCRRWSTRPSSASAASTSSSTTRPTRSTQPLGEFTLEAWNKSYDVNLRGPVFLVQYALPHLKASEHAAVVNVISAGAFLASTQQSMYAGAKAGADGVHACAGAASGRRTASGSTRSRRAPSTPTWCATTRRRPQARMAAASPMKRAAHADEMIGPVMFLVSDAGSFMTGQVVLADGGHGAALDRRTVRGNARRATS